LPVAGAAVLAAPVALIERPVEPAPITASSVDANVALPPAEPPGEASLCNEQKAQPFLMRAHFDSNYALGEEHRKQWAKVLGEAVRYRTEQYGYVEGYGRRAWNSRAPAEQADTVTFFGVPVTIHARVAPALACVEVAIKAHCQTEPYQPAVLSGMRKRNTYLNGEISNHVYGIAIDVDPMRNPCCGCIGSWRTNSRCQNQKSKFERMDMPKCWIKEFERFGFYWLGNDRIEDTMHFEFLADPSKILR
jgi:hypothetical protein